MPKILSALARTGDPSGVTVANISNAGDTLATIKKVIQEDGDNIVAISFNVGRCISFSNRVQTFLGEEAPDPSMPPGGWPNIAYDPPGETTPPRPGLGPHTTFDNLPLDSRPESYQSAAVEWFIEYALADYLRPVNYIVEPTTDVLAALGGELPHNKTDVAKLASDPNLLRHVQIVWGDFQPDQVSAALTQFCRLALNDQGRLEAFLQKTDSFIEGIYSWG